LHTIIASFRRLTLHGAFVRASERASERRRTPGSASQRPAGDKRARRGRALPLIAPPDRAGGRPTGGVAVQVAVSARCDTDTGRINPSMHKVAKMVT